ncbi:MAG TPA: SpoIID/LytB domain-containing protein [Gaiellaceae bacterium]|nr:SpoIID/LytB domain-containing protein [Gaiellaceae bacterium]
MPRRLLVPAVLAALIGATAASAANSAPAQTAQPVAAAARYTAPAGSGALFLFSGHGWGHGVGMSQWGAYGFAQHGATYDQILAHYYPGTTLGQAPLDTVRVLLAERKKRLAVSSDVPFTVVDGTGASHTLAAGRVVFGADLSLPVDGQPAPVPLAPPLTFQPGDGAPLKLGRLYRGQILVDVVDGRLRAVNVVSLEDYLDGVVPAEMPPSWLPEALKAQAVAARSYAMATRQVAAPFDLYGDTRSQLYLGASHESPAATAAVQATQGQVLMYGGAVAMTYFYSSSGGQTESSTDVWGGDPQPYLVSVDDPYDTISPYHDWGPVPVTAVKIARALKVPGTIMDVTTTSNGVGRVATLDVLAQRRTDPAPVADPVQATLARIKLGLRSTWFDVGVLSLTRPAPVAPVVYGSTVRLAGLVRGVDGVSLEERTSRSPWATVAQIAPGPDGTLQLTEQPTITTDYRLATPTAAAAYVRVRVTPSVTLTAPQTATTVAGTEQPVLSGAPVLVQQQSPDGSPAWTTVARGTVDAAGAFSVPVQLAPGTVRAVVAPGQGYWPGASAAVTVPG